MLVVGETRAPAAYPAVPHARGPATVHLRAPVQVLKLVDDFAAVPEGIVLQVVDAIDARGPARIEGIERLLHRHLAHVTVAVVGERDSRRDPGVEGMVAERLQAGRGAIDRDRV